MQVTLFLLVWFIKIFKRYINKVFINESGTIFIYFVSNLNLFFLSYYISKSFIYKFNLFNDLVGLDCIWKKNRFELYYQFLSLFYSFRFFYIYNEKITLKLPYTSGFYSLINIYKSANWLEREIWDLFGIYFKNHEDLRKILTDYIFIGFPLRKDFPLTGFYEICYDDLLKIIIIKNIYFIQDLRVFEFINPWKI